MSSQWPQSIIRQVQGTPSETGHCAVTLKPALSTRITWDLLKCKIRLSRSGVALGLCISNQLPEDANTVGLRLPLSIKILHHKSHFLTSLLCQSQLHTFYFFHYSNNAAMKIGIKYKSPSIVSSKSDVSEVANLFIYLWYPSAWV